MRVKHKNEEKNNKNKSMSLCTWHKEYYPNKKYLNYEFYDVPDIFDLYEIDKATGNLTYIKSDFASQIKHYARENPRKYIDKPHETKYLNEYLMPINKNIHSSLPRFFKIIKYIIPSIKLDTHRKRHITIVVLMLLTIAAMFFIAYYQGVFN
jgi:hypothetical protein